MGSPDELELIALYIGNLMTAFSVYLSVTFAYLTASYFTGGKMSRFQSATLTGLYFFSAISCIGSMTVNLLVLSDLEPSFPQSLQGKFIASADAWNVYMCSIMAVGTIISVYFLHDIRSKAQDQT